METFSKENFENLKNTCSKIISQCEDPQLGIGMWYDFLGNNIKNFIENPIVKNSGIIPKENIKEDEFNPKFK